MCSLFNSFCILGAIPKLKFWSNSNEFGFSLVQFKEISTVFLEEVAIANCNQLQYLLR